MRESPEEQAARFQALVSRGPAITKQSPVEDELGGSLGAMGVFNANGFYPRGLTTAEQVSLDIVETLHPVIYRCIDTISSDASQIPLVLKRQRKGGKSEVVEQHDAISYFDSIAWMNPADVSATWWRLAYADLLAAGNFYSYLGEPGITRPTDALRIDPAEMDVIPDPKFVVGGYKRQIPSSGLVRTYQPEQIWHVKTWNRRDRYRGLGVLARLRDPISIDQQMSKWRYQFFYNGVPTQIIFRTSSKIPTEGLRQRLVDHLERQLLARYNDGRQFAVIDADTWEVTVLPRAKDDEVAYTEGRKFERQLMAMAFGIPPNKMTDYSDPTALANAAQQDTFYWEDTIMNWHRLMIDHLNEKFLARFWPKDRDLYFEYDYRGVKALNQSAKEESEIQVALVRAGIRTRNEARETMGDDLSKNPLADELLVENAPLGAGALGLGGVGAGGGAPAPGGQNGNGNGNGAGKGRKQFDESIWNTDQDEKELSRLVDRQIVEMIRQAGGRQLQLAGLAGAFNMEDPRVLQFIRTQLVSLRREVVATTNTIIRAAIAEGLQRGLALASAELRTMIQAAFEERRRNWQLVRIARTETHTAQEGAGFLAAQQNGIERKRWLTARDDRVRGIDSKDKANHMALEALGPIPMDMKFRDPRSGAAMDFPGDRQGENVGPGDTINCRCTWTADFSDLDDDKAAELGVRKDWTPVDLDAAWHEKSRQQQDFESALIRQLRVFFRGMERRFLERWDRLAESERTANQGVLV